MNEKFDVRIEDRFYDAARGVTVVRVSYLTPGGDRVTLKGVAFTSPQDRTRQTKREGTFHAIRHACEYLATDYIDILDEALLAAVLQGLFAWDMPPAKTPEPIFPLWPPQSVTGPTGPFNFVIAG